MRVLHLEFSNKVKGTTYFFRRGQQRVDKVSHYDDNMAKILEDTSLVKEKEFIFYCLERDKYI